MVPWDSHESQNVIEAKRKEMHRFKRLKVFRVVTRESMDRGEEGKMISIKWVITNTGDGRTSNCQNSSGSTRSSTPVTSVVSCLQEHQV